MTKTCLLIQRQKSEVFTNLKTILGSQNSFAVRKINLFQTDLTNTVTYTQVRAHHLKKKDKIMHNAIKYQ